MSAAPPLCSPSPPACRECGGALSAGASGGICARCIVAEMQALPVEETGGVPRRHMGGYELLECIGRGGMGTVYRARHTDTGQVRALKMLTAGELAAPGARRRFLQEAKAAAGLQHPHIVTLHEAGMQDGMPYYVMDCLPGRTLAEAVKDKPMPAHAAAACMARVASAMQHAHSRGVLHRDLKPSNILLDELGEPRVADFGLARQMDADSSLTGTRQIMGSPPYMSPEQASGGGGRVSAASDVYALGAVLYHLLTGRPPFTGETPQAVLREVMEAEPVPPRRLRPSLPRELETITLRCLEKHPARRYASAADLAADLRRFLEGEPILARPVSLAARLLRRARRNAALTAMTALLVTGAAAGLTFILQKNRALLRSDAEKSTALSEKEATLAESLLWQAEFQRLTGKPGQREGSLAAVKAALQLPLTPEQKLRARNAAIAAVALPDARFVPDPHLTAVPDPDLFLTDPLCQHYATATREGKITVTRVSDGRMVANFDVAPRRLNALLRWSDDSQYLAYRFDDTKLGVALRDYPQPLWSAEAWRAGAESTPNQVVFHPLPGVGRLRPHRIIHAEPDGGIVIREAFTGVQYRRLELPEGAPQTEWRALAWDPPGTRMAAAAGQRAEVVIWDMNTTPAVVQQTLHCRAPVESLDWEVRENWLLAGDNEGRLTIWNPRTCESQPPFEGHSQPIVSTATGGANYRHASASRDGTVRLWDRNAYRPVLTLPGQASRIYFTSAERRVGPVLHDGRAGWYELTWPVCLHVLNPVESSEGARCAAYMENGTFLASLTGRAAVVRKTSPVSAHQLAIPHERPAALTWVPSAPWLMVAAEDGLHAHALRATGKYSIAAPVRVASLTLLESPCEDVCFDAAGTRLAVVRSAPGSIEVYRVDITGTRKAAPEKETIVLRERLWSVPAAPGTRCRLSPDGAWLAAGSPGGMDARILHGADGKVAAEPAEVRAARNWLPVFSKDGALLLFGGRTAHVLRCGDWAQCDAVPVPPNHGAGHGVEFITVSEGQDFLAAVGADEEVHLFRRDHPAQLVAVLRPPAGAAIGGLHATGSGVLCAAAPRGEVHLWPLRMLRLELEKLGLSWQGGVTPGRMNLKFPTLRDK